MIVVHPEGQHAHILAAALQKNSMLAHYFHGDALPKKSEQQIPAEKRTRVRWFQPYRRSLGYAVPPSLRLPMFERGFALFDRAVARRLAKFPSAAVVAYENAALETFRSAHRLGRVCILDAASVHHALQSKSAPGSNTKSMLARKDEELALADFTTTCSDLSLQSYRAAGVDADRIKAVRLGVDVETFTPSAAPPQGPIRFCAAGRIDRKKGMDLLASAAHRLKEDGLSFDLHIAGGISNNDAKLRDSLRAVARLCDRVPHAHMPAFYREADVFVMPSLFDSFGMVVTEALGCGLPVIVSENVGARDFISEGVNGWIIPAGDADALAARMAWCVRNPEAVRSMRPAARAAAETRSWDVYGQEIVDLILRVITEKCLEHR